MYQDYFKKIYDKLFRKYGNKIHIYLKKKEYNLNEFIYGISRFTDQRVRKEYDNIITVLNLPNELEIIYKIIGLPNAILVLVKDERNILYLDKLEQVFQNKEAYSHFIHLGHIYLGMGHIIGIGYSKITKKYFFRRDGGANGYECADHYNNYKDMQPEQYFRMYTSIFDIFDYAYYNIENILASLNNNIDMFCIGCKVEGCRFPLSHTTAGHTCGKCYQPGHGIRECGNWKKIEILSLEYGTDKMPPDLWCGLCKKDVIYRNNHSSSAHVCRLCKQSGQHSLQHCSLSI